MSSKSSEAILFPALRSSTRATFVRSNRRNVDLFRATSPLIRFRSKLVRSRLMMHQRVEVVRAKVMGWRWARQRAVLWSHRWRLTDVPFRQFGAPGRRMTRRWVDSGRRRDDRRWLRRLRVPGHRQATPAAAALFTLALVAPSQLTLAKGHAVHLESRGGASR